MNAVGPAIPAQARQRGTATGAPVAPAAPEPSGAAPPCHWSVLRGHDTRSRLRGDGEELGGLGGKGHDAGFVTKDTERDELVPRPAPELVRAAGGQVRQRA